MEAHLTALAPAAYRIGATPIRFEAGETIHTDNSHTYTSDAFGCLAGRGGWHPEQVRLDPEDGFSLPLLAA